MTNKMGDGIVVEMIPAIALCREADVAIVVATQWWPEKYNAIWFSLAHSSYGNANVGGACTSSSMPLLLCIKATASFAAASIDRIKSI